MKAATICKIILKNMEHWFFKLTNQQAKIFPYKVLLQLTNDCNSKCTSCQIWKINKTFPDLKAKESNLADYEFFFKGIGEHLLWLSFSGGEISLYEHWDELLKIIKEKCPKLKIITFTTNAIDSKKVLEIAKKIQNMNLDFFITISLDGDELTHDRIRGIPGNYQTAIQTSAELDNLKIRNYFGITLSGENYSFVKNLYFNYRTKMKAISIIHSNGIYNKENHLADEQILDSLRHISKNYYFESISDYIEWVFLKLGMVFLKKERKSQVISCDVLSSSIHVMPNGDINPCMYLPKITTIKNPNFMEELVSFDSLRIREKIKKQECPKCWMNCYGPHSIMQSPLSAIREALWRS